MAPAPDFEWITVPLRAFSLRDDDGAHASRATPAQIERWVEVANRTFEPARVRFVFNPRLFEIVLSTVLNHATDDRDPAFSEQLTRGNELAAGYPGSVVLLFRHGAETWSSGNGCAARGGDFVVMPSLQAEAFCGHANLTLLAHELGHHFGLLHTFTR